MNKKFLKFGLIGVALVLVISVVIKLVAGGKLPSYNYKDANLVQLQNPKDGQEIAIINTTLGEFKVMLFREQAPKAVEHFVNLAKAGYYDGKYIYGVSSPAYFFAGTTNKDGVIVDKDHKNYDTEMKELDVETSDDLFPFKGALILLGPDRKGSGTFITGINTIEMTDKIKKAFEKQEDANKDIVNAFLEKGGDPTLAHSYSIFAQTYEGMDVYEKIFKVDVDKNGRPKDELKIISIKISNYKA